MPRCLDFSGSVGRTFCNISGANDGMPVKRMSAPSTRASPIDRLPWLGMPMMSPAQASSASSRSRARNSTGLWMVMVLAGTHVAQLHAALEVAGCQAHEGDAVAVVGVHVGLDLEHEAADVFLVRGDRARLGRLHARRRGESFQGVQ